CRRSRDYLIGCATRATPARIGAPVIGRGIGGGRIARHATAFSRSGGRQSARARPLFGGRLRPHRPTGELLSPTGRRNRCLGPGPGHSCRAQPRVANRREIVTAVFVADTSNIALARRASILIIRAEFPPLQRLDSKMSEVAKPTE